MNFQPKRPCRCAERDGRREAQCLLDPWHPSRTQAQNFLSDSAALHNLLESPFPQESSKELHGTWRPPFHTLPHPSLLGYRLGAARSISLESSQGSLPHRLLHLIYLFLSVEVTAGIRATSSFKFPVLFRASSKEILVMC